MDITEKYIEMCKAKEIQERWRPSDGDFYAYPGGYHDSPVFIWGSKHMDEGLSKVGLSWLPRQDNLQDMLSATVTIGYMIVGLEAFYDHEKFCGYGDPPCRMCRNMGERRRLTYDTMEQWWLAFVMHEKFDKEWDAEKSEWTKDLIE